MKLRRIFQAAGLTIAIAVTAVAISIYSDYRREQRVIRDLAKRSGAHTSVHAFPAWIPAIVSSLVPIFNRVDEAWFDPSFQGHTVLPDLRGFKRLRFLHIHHQKLRPEDIAMIGGLPSLVQLSFDGVTMPDSDCRELRNLKGLRYLQLVESSLTDATVETIGTMIWLEFLDLTSSRENYWFRDTLLDDTDVKNLAGLYCLEELHLQDTQITDASIPVLQKLASLKVLDVRDTRMTQAGLNALFKSLPNCDVDPLPLDESTGRIPYRDDLSGDGVP